MMLCTYELQFLGVLDIIAGGLISCTHDSSFLILTAFHQRFHLFHHGANYTAISKLVTSSALHKVSLLTPSIYVLNDRDCVRFSSILILLVLYCHCRLSDLLKRYLADFLDLPLESSLLHYEDLSGRFDEVQILLSHVIMVILVNGSIGQYTYAHIYTIDKSACVCECTI